MCEAFQVVQGDVPRLAFDMANKRPVQAAFERKAFLGETSGLAQADQVQCQHLSG
jgi:hypothetical protein